MFLFFLLFLSSEGIIYSLQKSSWVHLDGVQLCGNQRGEFQPSCFSMKENVIPGDLMQSKTNLPDKGTKQNQIVQRKLQCYQTPLHCALKYQERGKWAFLCAFCHVLFLELEKCVCYRATALTSPGWACYAQNTRNVADTCVQVKQQQKRQFHPPCYVFDKFSHLVGVSTPLSGHFLVKHSRSLPDSLARRVLFSSWCPFLPHFLTSHFP